MSILPMPGDTDSDGTQHDVCRGCDHPIERLAGEFLWVEPVSGDDECIDGPTGRRLGVHTPDHDWTGQ